MKGEEFSVWFSGVGRLNAEQRRAVVAALAKLAEYGDAWNTVTLASIPD